MGEGRKLIAGCLTLLTLVAAGFVLSAPAQSDPAGLPQPVHRPWLDHHGVLNMAHQGGEFEAPSSTMYAFRTALEDRGADSLEMDVNATSDDRLAVMHDYYTSKIIPLDAQVRDLTLAELQALDAAYWFSPGTGQFNHTKPADQYPLRGVRTGGTAPPEGYTADDFRVPAMEEVLAAFPGVPLNIEIKSVPGEPGESIRVATLLAELLNRPENADRQIIVASLDQNALVKFHQLAPKVDISASLTSMIGFIGTGTPIEPKPAALQVPMVIGELDVPKVLQEMDVAAMGYPVHAWTDGAGTENDESYAKLIEAGVKGIMTSSPAVLHDYLCRAAVRRPDRSPRCANQRLKYKLKFPSRSLKLLLRKPLRGFPVVAICDQPCSAQIALRIRPAAAKRLGIKRKPGPQDRGLVRIGWGMWSSRGEERKVGANRSDAFVNGKYRKQLSKARRIAVEFSITIYDEHMWRGTFERRWVVLKAPKPKRRSRK